MRDLSQVRSHMSIGDISARLSTLIPTSGGGNSGILSSILHAAPSRRWGASAIGETSGTWESPQRLETVRKLWGNIEKKEILFSASIFLVNGNQEQSIAWKSIV